MTSRSRPSAWCRSAAATTRMAHTGVNDNLIRARRRHLASSPFRHPEPTIENYGVGDMGPHDLYGVGERRRGSRGGSTGGDGRLRQPDGSHQGPPSPYQKMEHLSRATADGGLAGWVGRRLPTMSPWRRPSRPTAGVRRPPHVAAPARPRSWRRRGRSSTTRACARPDRGHRQGCRHQPGDRLPALHRQGGPVRADDGRATSTSWPRSWRPSRRRRRPRGAADRDRDARSPTTHWRTRPSSTAPRR